MPIKDKPLNEQSVSRTRGKGLQSQQFFSGSAYGPEELKIICRAFDQAWAAIRPLVDDTPLAQDAARLKLANTILSVVKHDPRDKVRRANGDRGAP